MNTGEKYNDHFAKPHNTLLDNDITITELLLALKHKTGESAPESDQKIKLLKVHSSLKATRANIFNCIYSTGKYCSFP